MQLFVTKKSTFLVSAIIPFMLLMISNAAFAQQVMLDFGPFHIGPTDYITYTDPKLRFSIKYPSHWEKVTNDPDSPFVSAPIKSDADAIVSVTVSNGSASLSADELGKYELSHLQYRDFTPLELNTNTYFLTGHPAYRLIYTAHDKTSQEEWKFMEYGTIVGNNYYTVSFLAKSEKYSDYLPNAQEMINSLHIAGQ